VGVRSVTTGAVDAFAAEVGPPDAGPVTAVGGRTQWAVGGIVAPEAREVRAPAGIVAVEAADMTARVRAGTTVSELDAALAEVDQTVALPAWVGATVGGILAVGHSGLRRLGWGPVRDVLLEARVVSADGRVVKAGGPTVKNVSGYDLCRVLVGSLGMLAFTAEVVLRTRPLPPAERWLAGDVDPFALVERLYRPATVLWDGATTWLLLDGHPDDVAAQSALAGLAGVDGPPGLPGPHRWSLRPSELPALGTSLGAGPGRFVAEVGVGVVHAERPPLPRPVDRHVAELHRRIKAVFDPYGRLNPGRDPLAATAAVTPADPAANRRSEAPESATSERRNPGPA
jgi:FAD/FMN-containing dehydrogenase